MKLKVSIKLRELIKSSSLFPPENSEEEKKNNYSRFVWFRDRHTGTNYRPYFFSLSLSLKKRKIEKKIL